MVRSHKTKKPIVRQMEDSDAVMRFGQLFRKRSEDNFGTYYTAPGRYIVIPKKKIRNPTKLLTNLLGKGKRGKFKDPVAFLTGQDVHLDLDMVKVVKEVRGSV